MARVNRRQMLCLAAGATGTGGLFFRFTSNESARANLCKVKKTARAFGTSASITVLHPDQRIAAAAADPIFPTE